LDSIIYVYGYDLQIFFIIIFLCGFRVDIDIPKVEVRFENLFVEGDAFNGSRALPTLVNSTMNAIEVLLTLSFVS